MKWLRKNIPVITVGLILTGAGIMKAYIDRGYWAYGGEYLILPILLMARKLVSDVKEAFTDEFGISGDPSEHDRKGI